MATPGPVITLKAHQFNSQQADNSTIRYRETRYVKNGLKFRLWWGKFMSKKHARFSASASDRWLNCPGSISLSEKAPPQPDSPYAAEGTLAHDYLEKVLNSFIQDPKKLVSPLLIGAPRDMKKHVISTANQILKYKSKYAKLYAETRSSLSFIHRDMWGTADAVVALEGDTLTVIDFKYGQGVLVSPQDNTQLIFYALGVAHKFQYNFEMVKLVIIQPRAADENGDTVKEHQMTIEELKSWRAKFKDGVKAALKKNAPLKQGDHCKWCPAVTICPEVSSRALERAKTEFTDIVEAKPLPLHEMDLTQALHAANALSVWISAVRSHAYQKLAAGQEVPGYKLVEKRAIRKWLDAEETADQAKKTFGNIAFHDPELLSPAQLEKVVGKEWVESRVAKVSSGLTLVEESDGRQATSNAEIQFDEIN